MPSAAKRRGAASLVLVVLLLALLGLVLALLLQWGPGGATQDSTASPEASEARTSPETAPSGTGPRPRSTLEPPADPAPSAAESSPAPRGADAAPRAGGSLRGSIDVAPGGLFPERWTLAIGPSQSLVGRENAATRALEFDGSQRDFHVKDLPFAGYDVRAIADGMNGPVVPVLIRKESASPYVTLVLRPAGFIEGAVLDEEGLGVEGLPVALEPLPEGQALRTHTDVRGVYHFPAVLDGDYRLVFGNPLSAIGEPRLLSFRAPSLHVPNTVLDVLGRVRVVVLDPAGRPVPGARVRGQGSKGGYVDFFTDERGTGWAHFLPAGRYHLYGLHEDFAAGTTIIDLRERQELHLEIELRHL